MHWLARESQMAASTTHLRCSTALQRRIFVASALPPRKSRVACSNRSSGGEQLPGGSSGRLRRGLLQLLGGGAMLAAGFPRSVATAAVVDKAEQVGAGAV